MPNDASYVLRRRDVQVRTGLAPSSLYQLIQSGQFPKPIQLSERRVGWLASEVEAWIKARVEARASTTVRARVRAQRSS